MYNSSLQFTMVTGIFLTELEIKQLLQHQFLFNSKSINDLTYLINSSIKWLKKKKQKKANGQIPVHKKKNYVNSLNRPKDAKPHSKERCKLKLHPNTIF